MYRLHMISIVEIIMIPKVPYESNTSIEGIQYNFMHQSTVNTLMIKVNILNNGNHAKGALRLSHPNRNSVNKNPRAPT